MNKKIIFGLGTIAIIGVIYVNTVKNASISLETTKVTKNSIANYISEDAKTILEREHTIYTPIDGIVIPNEFKEGDMIKKGQIIAKFDNYNRSEKLNSLKSKLIELHAMIEGVDTQRTKKEEIAKEINKININNKIHLNVLLIYKF